MQTFEEMEKLLRLAASVIDAPGRYTELQRRQAVANLRELANQFSAFRSPVGVGGPVSERHYCLMGHGVAGNEEKPRLFASHADPFDTPEEAVQYKKDVATEKDLYLVLRVLIPIRRLPPNVSEDD